MKWLFNIFNRRRDNDNDNDDDEKETRREGGVLIPHPPVLDEIHDTYTPAQARQKLRKLSSHYLRKTLFDRKYVAVKHNDISKIARWWHDTEQNLIREGYGYLAEVSDCDDRAVWGMALNRMIYRDHEATLLSAKLGVTMEYSALGIAQGVQHMTNAIYTNRGWYVVEFPTGQHCTLSKYPNPIWGVY